MIIGYIGLGLMGTPCVANLLKAGYEVFVWGRRPESMNPSINLGAKPCDSIKSLTSKVDILFTNLTNTKDVEEVIFGENGVTSVSKKDLTIVDMSTISALATKKMAKKLTPLGIELVDAPVSGGTIGAQQGTLTIMVGSSQKTFERLKPILSVMGKNITRIGETGAGQVAKSCNQIVITGTLAAVSEALAFSKALDVDFEPIREALLGGFASSRVLEVHAKRMMEDSYEPGFKTVLHAKDMDIVQDIASEMNLSMHISNYGNNLLHQTVNDGYSELDSSIIYKLITKKMYENTK